MNGDILPKGIMVPDLGACHPAFPFQVLSFKADARERKKLIVAANDRVAINDHMRMKETLSAQDHIGANNTVGADSAIRANLSLGIDNGGGMNAGYRRGHMGDFILANSSSIR